MNITISDGKLEGINLLGTDWLRKARIHLAFSYNSKEPQLEMMKMTKIE